MASCGRSWAANADPTYPCDRAQAQEAPCCGLGSFGPAQIDASSCGLGWTSSAAAVGNGDAYCGIAKALQRRVAKRRPCSWRGGCRRRACRRLKMHPTSPGTQGRSACLPQRSQVRAQQTRSNGRLAAHSQGQDTADFSGASKEAAWNSQPCADTDQRAVECTQRWAWNAGNPIEETLRGCP
eukprot:2602116-Amphidinium_carterae.1